MGAAVALTLGFVAVEAACGWVAHSLALLSDAGHNLADAAALGFSWYALSIADKPSHQGMTFGYHRVGILAALANAVYHATGQRIRDLPLRLDGLIASA